MENPCEVILRNLDHVQIDIGSKNPINHIYQSINFCLAKNVGTAVLPYDKSLIAYTLGMKGATFSRALNILRQKTNMRITGSRVEIDSVEDLARFVYGAFATQYIQEYM